jgi:hypothetical protein
MYAFSIRNCPVHAATTDLPSRNIQQEAAGLPLRSVKRILDAEQEFFTKVWYGRKASAARYRAEGTPEEIIKGMLRGKRD